VTSPANGFADFHLARSGDPTPPSRLGTAWTVALVHDGWTLQIAAPTGSALVETARTGDWSAWLFGDLLRYRDDPDRPIERFVTDLAIGRATASSLNGSFVVLALHRSTGEWHLWTDRLGTLPAYVASDGGDTVVSTFFQAAVGDRRRELDRLGLAGFARLGMFLGDHTWVEGVRAVRPATHHVMGPDGSNAAEERYWQWWHQPRPDRPTNDTLAAFDDALSAIVDDHARRGRLVVPLSGGLDSRTVFAVATRDHPDHVAALSYGYWAESPEIRIPRAIARARGVALRELVVPDYLFDRLDTVLDAVEGFSALCFTRQIGALDGFVDLGDRVVGAHWGDVWFDDFGASGLDGDALTDRAVALLAKPGGAHLQQLLRPGLADVDVDAELRRLVEAELDRVPDLTDADMRIKAFKTDQWSARWTIPGTCAYRAALPLALPFYDNRMVDFFLTVPTEVLSGRRLQIEYLKRYHPDLASIPWEATGRSLFTADDSPTVRRVRRVASKARRRLARTPAISRNWEVQYGSPVAHAEVSRRLGALPCDLVEPAAVANVLADWQRHPNGANGYEVDMLVTIAAMLPRITNL